jgi:two-component system response regulator
MPHAIPTEPLEILLVEDGLKAYGLPANRYITKSIDVGDFAAVVRSIEHFWLNVVTLPPE